MIHPKRKISFRDLEGIKLRRPKQAGAFWQGVPHHELVETIERCAATKGWRTSNLRLATSNDQHDVAGSLRCEIDNVKLPNGVSLSLGFVSSNAQRFRFRLFIGVTVGNKTGIGIVLGTVNLAGGKHTTHFDLDNTIAEGLDSFEFQAKHVRKTINKLRRRMLSVDKVNAILMEAGRSNVIPWTKIGKTERIFREAMKDASCWSLLKAFWYPSKTSVPLKQMSRANAFRILMNRVLKGNKSD